MLCSSILCSCHYEKFVPFPVCVVQEGERAAGHGVDGLTQQPVFVLTHASKQIQWKTLVKEQISDVAMIDVNSNLPGFVKAAVSRSLNIAKLLLVLRCCRPGGVRSWRRQHEEERLLRDPVLQEGKGPVRLGGGNQIRLNTPQTPHLIQNTDGNSEEPGSDTRK